MYSTYAKARPVQRNWRARAHHGDRKFDQMKATGSIESEALLEELAASWIIEREEGFAPNRAEAFADWCIIDPRNSAAVARVENTLALLNEMPSVRAQLEMRVVRMTRQ